MAKFFQIENRLSYDEFSQLVEAWDEKQSNLLLSEPIPFGKLSGRIARVFLTPKDAPIPDCQTCGLCCAFFTAVQVETADTTAPENYWELTRQTDAGEFVVDRVLRRDAESGFCSALSGEIGQTVGCEIYQNRPQTCRRFEAGSDKCHALRRRYGLEPPLSQMELMRALVSVLEKDAPAEDADKIIYHSQIGIEAQASLITVWLEDDSSLLIHRYETNEENWLEGDFVGLTLAEAQQLIGSREHRQK